jgi:hypothetical protein
MDFCVALEFATRDRADARLIYPDEMVMSLPDQTFSERDPFALRVRVVHHGVARAIGLVPDLVFGLTVPDGSRRCFMVEIDRGTPSRRSLEETIQALTRRAEATSSSSC